MFPAAAHGVAGPHTAGRRPGVRRRRRRDGQHRSHGHQDQLVRAEILPRYEEASVRQGARYPSCRRAGWPRAQAQGPQGSFQRPRRLLRGERYSLEIVVKIREYVVQIPKSVFNEYA